MSIATPTRFRFDGLSIDLTRPCVTCAIAIALDLELLGFKLETEHWHMRSFRLQPDKDYANVAYPALL